MPVFEFTITAPATMSARVQVEAKSLAEAQDMALSPSFYEKPENAAFTLDDGNPIDEVYLPDPEDFEILPETDAASASAVSDEEAERRMREASVGALISMFTETDLDFVRSETGGFGGHPAYAAAFPGGIRLTAVVAGDEGDFSGFSIEKGEASPPEFLLDVSFNDEEVRAQPYGPARAATPLTDQAIVTSFVRKLRQTALESDGKGFTFRFDENDLVPGGAPSRGM